MSVIGLAMVLYVGPMIHIHTEYIAKLYEKGNSYTCVHEAEIHTQITYTEGSQR